MVELQIGIAKLFDSWLQFVAVELIEAVFEKIFEPIGDGHEFVETALKQSQGLKDFFHIRSRLKGLWTHQELIFGLLAFLSKELYHVLLKETGLSVDDP